MRTLKATYRRYYKLLHRKLNPRFHRQFDWADDKFDYWTRYARRNWQSFGVWAFGFCFIAGGGLLIAATGGPRLPGAVAAARRPGVGALRSSLVTAGTTLVHADLHNHTLLSDGDGGVAAAFGVKRRFGPLPVKRHTFVIDTDRTVIEVIKSEFAMNAHADKALTALRERAGRTA